MDLPGRGDFNILLVDDVSRNLQVLGSILRQDGYALSFATDGEQALELASSGRFDLILLDVMMPGMDGLEVCSRLKTSPATRGVPVIFLTAKTDKDDIVKGLELGAVDYVSKPFNSAELLVRVRTHLELGAARAQIQRHNEELHARNAELERVNAELTKALGEIRTLRGILPICMQCKKIRKEDADPTSQESWIPLEAYISSRTGAQMSHGLCPACLRELYPDLFPPRPWGDKE